MIALRSNAAALGLLVSLGACSDYGLSNKRSGNGENLAPPTLTADPTALDLGLVCDTGTAPVALQNVGGGPLTISALQAPDGWAVAHDPLPRTLDPGERWTIEVTGVGAGALTVVSDDPNQPELLLPLDAVADAPPSLTLLTPAPDITLDAGALTVFEAQVWDDLDPAEALDLRWSSSVDGPLDADPPDAAGQAILLWDGNQQTPGPQTVEATLTDSCGHTVTATRSFCQEEGYDTDQLDLDTWNFEGTARYDTDNDWVELTSAAEWQGGTAFQTAAEVPSDDVVIAFSFFAGDRGGADGISLTVLDADRMTGFVGSSGGGIGYGGLPGWTVEIDTFYNRYDPSEADHVSLHIDGDAADAVAVAELPEMEDGAWHDMEVVARGEDLTVSVDGVVYLDLRSSRLGAFPAYVGFTGATGASYNAHYIDSLVVAGSLCEGGGG